MPTINIKKYSGGSGGGVRHDNHTHYELNFALTPYRKFLHNDRLNIRDGEIISEIRPTGAVH